MPDNVNKENKETRLSQDLIDVYASDHDMRYRMDAVRALLEIGLKSLDHSKSLDFLVDANGPHEKRTPLSVSKHTHSAVEKVRKKIPVQMKDRTYELAYRLVILHGLRLAGGDIKRIAAQKSGKP